MHCFSLTTPRSVLAVILSAVIFVLFLNKYAFPMPDERKGDGVKIAELSEDFEYLSESKYIASVSKGKREILRINIDEACFIDFVKIPRGEFVMGSSLREEGRYEDEHEHKAILGKNFFIGMYEITQEQYSLIMDVNPSAYSKNGVCSSSVKGIDTTRFPVESVSWDDASEFCSKLSKLSKRKITLPTEAQWEYSCRAGTDSAFSFGRICNGELANCSGVPYGTKKRGQQLLRPTTVGSYKPNPFGIYDMHGNVEEWCLDYYDEYKNLDTIRDPLQIVKQDKGERVTRSGGWKGDARMLRSSTRLASKQNSSADYRGFRVCLTCDE
jgi:formylglycine-generating enzyme required for sulfatase activity